jgi:hypothetical protein
MCRTTRQYEFAIEMSMRQYPQQPLPIGSYEWNTGRIEPMARVNCCGSADLAECTGVRGTSSTRR